MTTFLSGPVTVSVPATSANLGPGYDALGLALDHRDTVIAEIADELAVTVEGEGAGVVPLDETHLVHRSLRACLDLLGADVPPLRLHCVNVVPHARGLGSSSAAIVAGVSLARGLVAGGSLLLDDAGLLALAADLEGHPDNVAPALLGGFTIAYRDGDRFAATSLGVDPRVQVVAFVPPDGVETTAARGLLPAQVPHADAAHNAGRAALLVAALTQRPELLLAATEDRLHQTYRSEAMPRTLEVVTALRERGVAAVVSGAGPTVLVLASTSDLDGRTVDVVPADWRRMSLGVGEGVATLA